MVVIDSVYSFDIPVVLGKLGDTHVWCTESSLNKCFFFTSNVVLLIFPFFYEAPFSGWLYT